jgi:hypothetical protein
MEACLGLAETKNQQLQIELNQSSKNISKQRKDIKKAKAEINPENGALKEMKSVLIKVEQA